MKGYMYILECSDGSYYTGSTIDLDVRIKQHQNGEGANHTKKHLPVILVYSEEFSRIDEAFYREKQVQGWSRKKKEALINSEHNKLPKLSMAYRDMVVSNDLSVVSSASTTDNRAKPEVLLVPEVLPVPEVLEGTFTKKALNN